MLSSIHLGVIDFIKKEFPFLKLSLEFQIPKTKLRIDIFLPDIDLAIEIQGIQHYEYSEFFHKNQLNFMEANIRDVEKNKICKKMNLEILYIRYDCDNFLDRVSAKIKEKISKMEEEKIIPFIDNVCYELDDINYLVCPICKNELDFSSSNSDSCCGRVFTLIKKGKENYYAVSKKIEKGASKK